MRARAAPPPAAAVFRACADRHTGLSVGWAPVFRGGLSERERVGAVCLFGVYAVLTGASLCVCVLGARKRDPGTAMPRRLLAACAAHPGPLPPRLPDRPRAHTLRARAQEKWAKDLYISCVAYGRTTV